MNGQMPTNMAELILSFLKSVNESDEFFEVMASMAKKLYDALLDVGFTDTQATQIVAGFAARGGK